MLTDSDSDADGSDDAAMQPLLRLQELVDQGRYSEADECFEQFAEHVGQRVEEFANDPEFQEELHLSQLEIEGQWSEVLRIHQARLAQTVGDKPSSVARAHQRLAGCYELLGALHEAATHCAAATIAARTEDWPFGLALHLNHEGQVAFEQGRHEHALNCFNEALANLEAKKSHDHLRTMFLLGRAKCLLARKDVTNAEADHRKAWECLAPMSAMEGACGIQATFAAWWELEAVIWEQREEVKLAQHGWEMAIHHRRKAMEAYGDPNPHLANQLARTLFKAAQAMQRFDEADKAADFIAESHAIRRGIRLPPFIAN
jgi:tetratricopeptide (TPR) repeat protein